MREVVMYAQNWEDPELELAELDIERDDEVVAIGGGGCTALSLLARGPRRIHVIDRNPAQIHLLLLKFAAASQLQAAEAAGFLGGTPMSRRLEILDSLALPQTTTTFWRERRRCVARGVLSQGRVERYFALLRGAVRIIHSKQSIDDLFSQRSIGEQERFYRDRWDTAPWRALFLLAHRRILDRVLVGAYEHIGANDVAADLRHRAGVCMSELLAGENYFLSWILRGRYPVSPSARPPYLQRGTRDRLLRFGDRMETHVTDLRAFLRTRPDSSCDKFYLSNVAEWLPEAELEAFFEEVLRVAKDGATVCHRALMADRPLPARIAAHLFEDPVHSAAQTRRDRAFVNAAFHVARVRKCGGTHAVR